MGSDGGRTVNVSIANDIAVSLTSKGKGIDYGSEPNQDRDHANGFNLLS